MKAVSRLWTDPRLIAWATYSLLVAPFTGLVVLSRLVTGRRPHELNGDRWRLPSLTPEASARIRQMPGPHVVLVGGGFGELMMIERVADALRMARPGLRISYSLRDLGTIEFVKRERPDQNLVLWPFDSLPSVGRWLKLLEPDLVVFTERFRFTTLSCGAARYGARVALMNGRCRFRKSFKYRLFAPFYRWQFSAFTAMAMQRRDFFEATHQFAAKGCDIRLTGDIKTDLRVPSLDGERLASLDRWLSRARELPLVVAGSTETAEEERMVLRAFQRARSEVPCRLLIAPRRPGQIEALLEQIAEEGLSVSRRSFDEPAADVMLLDTLGELSTAYGSGVAAYVGGAFSENGGGHNVMEPLLWGTPVAYGYQRGHFEALQRLLEEQHVGWRISGDEELAAFWIRFLTKPEDRSEVGDRGKRVIEENRGAVARTVAMLLPLLRTNDSGR